MTYRRVLRVFLASPSDLGDERSATADVLDELATLARELNVTLELLGWEDTPPAARRPQEVINNDLLQSDLFIGLLWRRWGQPTGNPQFSSGFEEEYYLARDLNNRVNKPDLWLFFKEIEAAQRQDPGDQLNRVLLFRAKCEDEKQVLFKEFKTTADWTRLLRTLLSQHLARLGRNTATEPAGEGLQLISNAHLKPMAVGSNSDVAASLRPLAHTLETLAKGGDPEEYARRDRGFNAVRLYLVGLSLLARSETSSGLVNTHEINTLYRCRNDFEPLDIESTLLQRTVLADRSSVKPGWYWFPQDAASQIDILVSFALTDREPEVRRGVFDFLTRTRTRSDKWTHHLFSREAAEAQPLEVRNAFWTYLDAIVTTEDRKLIEGMQPSTADGDRIASLLLVARSEAAPDSVLAEAAVSPQPPSHRLVNEMSARLQIVDDAVLIAAFSSRHQTLRDAIATELERRHLFGDIRTAAQDDTSEAIRILEYRDRLRTANLAGTDPPELPDNLSYDAHESLAVERLRPLAYEQLVRRIDWYPVEGRYAYRVLATDHWGAFAGQVRSDTADQFVNFRNESIERLARRFIPNITEQRRIPESEAREEAIREVTTQLSDLEGFIGQGFAAAALAGIERNGDARDAPFVRSLPESTRTRAAAIRALARVGDASDVPSLIRIAEEAYGEAKGAAANAALRLSGDSAAVIRAFVRSSDSALVEIALSKMSELGDESLKSIAVELLRSETASVRILAAQFLTKLLNAAELLVVLKDYIGQGEYYYYNVVVDIDRSLHCLLTE